MDPEREAMRVPKHRRTGTAFRVLRGVLMAVIAAVVAVLVSGFLQGDPRITALFPGVSVREPQRTSRVEPNRRAPPRRAAART